MARIFISYSRRNAKIAQKLASRLREAGHYPWLDSAQLLVGDSVTRTIEEAIQGCDFLCFVITRASLASQWARDEVGGAIAREMNSKSIKVLPLLADRSLTPNELPAFLVDKRYADFRTDFNRGFVDLIHTVDPPKHYSDTVALNVTCSLGDLMQSAISIIKNRFPGYEIVDIGDRGRATREWLFCSGRPGNCDIEWKFNLKREKSHAIGLERCVADIHPIWDILMKQFPGADEILFWPIEQVEGAGRDEYNLTIHVEGCECTALDAELSIIDRGKP